MVARLKLEQQYIEDRAFWGSVGSRWRGLAGGAFIGMGIGLALGIAAVSAFTLFTGATVASLGMGSIMAVVGTFAASGAMTGVSLWGSAGQISGAVAAGLTAQKELDKSKAKELSQDISLDQVPAEPKRTTPLINWKVSAIGALATGTLGAILAATGNLPATASFLLLGQTAGTGAAAGAAAVTLGLFGTVFGVAHTPWQAFKRWTDGLFEGKLSGRDAPSMPQLREHLLNQSQAPEAPAQSRPGKPTVLDVESVTIVGAPSYARNFTEQLLQERGKASTLDLHNHR
jgi:hypothetical protein